MAKKKNNPGMMPDLFADFGASSDATNEQNEEKEATPEAPETTPSADNETVPTGASVEVQEKTTVPAADDDSVSKAQSESITPSEPKSIAGKNKLPAILCDDTPAELNGELALARYAASAYLEYALSVVKSRALPDIFDGMKPVQRRILYAMDRMRLNPPAKAVKCARVVGDVLGKYHPHGDQAAYDAMVRMAQDFSLRYPLVDGEGNFGSRDGDGPAAMRYTEARLTKISELVLSELDSEDVDFVPNYDGSFKEPVQLPAKLPFVLLNGASGIAVGMATEIPSHNLNEVAQAALCFSNPEATLDEILDHARCRYPGGGHIISSPSEIRQTYAIGRGSLRVRACYHFEELQRGQWQLVVDELPPAANAELVLSQMKRSPIPSLKQAKKPSRPNRPTARQRCSRCLTACATNATKTPRCAWYLNPRVPRSIETFLCRCFSVRRVLSATRR